MAEKTILERLQAILDADTNTKLKAAVQKHPELLVDDAFAASVVSIFELGGSSDGDGNDAGSGAGAGTGTGTATHTAALPSAAGTSSAAQPVIAESSTNSNAAILAALTGIKTSLTSMEDKFKNVVTKDQIPVLGAQLVNDAIAHSLRQADELSTIRETFHAEFPDKKWDKKAFEDFVLANQTETEDPATHAKIKRNKFSTLTDAYDAMVGKDRMAAEIAKGVADGVKQKMSGATVPGQTTSTALSAAQQVMAKAKKDQAAEGGSRLQNLIERASQLEKARESSGAVN